MPWVGDAEWKRMSGTSFKEPIGSGLLRPEEEQNRQTDSRLDSSSTAVRTVRTNERGQTVDSRQTETQTDSWQETQRVQAGDGGQR